MARLADLEARIARAEKKIEAYKPLSGINTSVSDAQGGRGRVIDATGGGNTTIVSVGELQLVSIDNSTLGITPGGVAGCLEDGTDTFSVSGDGTIWAQVDVDAAGTGFSNLVIFDNGTSAAPTADSTHAYILIGGYRTDAGNLIPLPAVDGSVTLTTCRNDPTTGNIVPTWNLV